MNYAEESLRLHGEWKGKIEVVSRVSVKNKEDLSLAYTPGVARPCLEIQKDYDKSFTLTRRSNLVAPEELTDKYILPAAFDPRVGPAVAAAVAQAARDSGVARL